MANREAVEAVTLSTTMADVTAETLAGTEAAPKHTLVSP